MVEVDEARSLAERLLAEQLPRRWAHTQGVARRAREIGDSSSWARISLLVSAAWLHDIGYSPRLAVTGFHPLDGARFLRDEIGADPELCELVAHHTGADIEAEVRGMLEPLVAEFGPLPASDTLEMLTASDVTTGPDGVPVDPANRIAEILQRYEPGSPVHTAVSRSGPDLIQMAARYA